MLYLTKFKFYCKPYFTRAFLKRLDTEPVTINAIREKGLMYSCKYRYIYVSKTRQRIADFLSRLRGWFHGKRWL